MRGGQEYQTTVSNLVEMIRKAGSIGVTIAVARNFLAETGCFAEGVVGKRLGNAFGRVLKSAYHMPNGLVRQKDRLIHASFVSEQSTPEPEVPAQPVASTPPATPNSDEKVVEVDVDLGFDLRLSARGFEMTVKGPLHFAIVEN